jgi:glycosyltransferase involved in cell wall biosynthesis
LRRTPTRTSAHPLLSGAERLARKSIYALRSYGWRGFSVRARRTLLRSLFRQSRWDKVYSAEAMQFATTLDCTPAELEQSQHVISANAGPLQVATITWFLPHFEHAYYGGIYTILRFAASFAERWGIRNTFIMLSDAGITPAATYLERITTAFPQLAHSTAIVHHAWENLAALPATDVCIATYWNTAFSALRYNQTKRKCYFIQDFEPMFFPAGSTSAQVEATYRFGLYGIANTRTLKQIYEQQFQGTATFFDPCVDTSLFYPPASRSWDKPPAPATVFFYARPDYWRNGFELGAVALRQLKERMGARVRIISAGQQWSPREYGLDGVIENLGLLIYPETAALYRTCDVGLTMMFTRHPSYLPFEFMASGCMVVSNISDATSWLLQDGQNCLLTLPVAGCIADTLARALEDHALRQRITHTALAMIQKHYTDWDKQIEKVYRFLGDPVASAQDLA